MKLERICNIHLTKILFKKFKKSIPKILKNYIQKVQHNLIEL